MLFEKAELTKKTLQKKLSPNELRQKIMNFQIGSEDDQLSFCERLARENNWNLKYAESCVEEYKKFIYLITISNEQLTPSDQVDQVWHLHLAYTKSYWQDLCANILQKPIHHEPTTGGNTQEKRFRRQYQYTLDKYRQIFGQMAPVEIWPTVKERFKQGHQFIRINRSESWIFPKPSRLLGALLLFPLLLLACTSGEGDSGNWFYVKLVVGLYLLYRLIKWIGSQGGGSGGGCGGASGCSSGCGGS